MCDGSKCAVFSSLFLSLWGTGCDIAREVETACRLCFSPLQIDVYLFTYALFCANWSSDAVKGACFHPVFTGPLGDRREVKCRCTAWQRALWCSRSDFPPYLMSTLWRWWQPHPVELPDSWGAWKDAHTSLLLLYLLYGERTSTEEEDGGGSFNASRTTEPLRKLLGFKYLCKETLKHKHKSIWFTSYCYFEAVNKYNSPHVHTTMRRCWAARRGRNRTARRAKGKWREPNRAAAGRARGPGWVGTMIWEGLPAAPWSPTSAVIYVRSGLRPGTGRSLWWWGRMSRTAWCCSARWAHWSRYSVVSPCRESLWGWKLPSHRGRFSHKQHPCW